MLERTVIVFKPDAVERGLVGEVLSRFEKVGLRIVGSKTVQVDKKFVSLHYPDRSSYLRSVGKKTLEGYIKDGIDPKEIFGTSDPLKIGKKIRRWNTVYLSGGSVIAFVLEGERAVAIVRKMVGKTNPSVADPGTIRADYSSDSFELANREHRSVRNLIHASGTAEEAKEELRLWFKDHELI
jgi:nucleoside-diphosphate kinase